MGILKAPIQKANRFGKPYSQQPGRKKGKGAGHIVDQDEYFSIRDQFMKEHTNIDTKYLGGTNHFTGLKAKDLKFLMDQGYAPKHGRQNDSPTANEFYKFIKMFPNVTAHGYVVSPLRSDHRISIEGLEFKGKMTPKLGEHLEMFLETAPAQPDDKEVGVNGFRIWWD